MGHLIKANAHYLRTCPIAEGGGAKGGRKTASSQLSTTSRLSYQSLVALCGSAMPAVAPATLGYGKVIDGIFSQAGKSTEVGLRPCSESLLQLCVLIFVCMWLAVTHALKSHVCVCVCVCAIVSIHWFRRR